MGVTRESTEPGRLRDLAGAETAAALAAGMANDLEPAVLSLRPDLAGVLDALKQADGVLGAQVTGSGPTCFGVFPDRASAEAGAAAIGPLIPQSAGALPAVVAGLRQNPVSRPRPH
jgi:4-diphosphocytidyl-2-C-methyl-D-erythritol kinase